MISGILFHHSSGKPTDSAGGTARYREKNLDYDAEPHGIARQAVGFMSLALRKVTKEL